jgi:hypothetical protein
MNLPQIEGDVEKDLEVDNEEVLEEAKIEEEETTTMTEVID